MISDIRDILISSTTTILETLRVIDQTALEIALVLEMRTSTKMVIGVRVFAKDTEPTWSLDTEWPSDPKMRTVAARAVFRSFASATVLRVRLRRPLSLAMLAVRGILFRGLLIRSRRGIKPNLLIRMLGGVSIVLKSALCTTLARSRTVALIPT